MALTLCRQSSPRAGSLSAGAGSRPSRSSTRCNIGALVFISLISVLSRLCLKSESVSVSVFVACVLLCPPSFIHPSLTLSHESHEVGVRGCAVIGFALVQQHEGARRARRPEVCLLPLSRSSCSCVQGPAGALTYRWLEDSDALHEMVAIADAVCKVRCVFARACARPCTCSSACGLHSTAISARAGRAVQT